MNYKTEYIPAEKLKVGDTMMSLTKGYMYKGVIA